jgi:hypothetical protein
MLKQSSSIVLASFRPSTYPRGYAFGPSLAAALLDELFEHSVEMCPDVPDTRIANVRLITQFP